MRRTPAVETEVIGSVDQADSEVVVPDPIDHHPGEQRVFRTRDPHCQLLSSLRVGSIGGQADALDAIEEAIRVPDSITAADLIGLLIPRKLEWRVLEVAGDGPLRIDGVELASWDLSAWPNARRRASRRWGTGS